MSTPSRWYRYSPVRARKGADVLYAWPTRRLRSVRGSVTSPMFAGAGGERRAVFGIDASEPIDSAVHARSVRRRRHRRRPQRARCRRSARQAGRARRRARAPFTGRWRGDHRAAVGRRLPRHRAVVRRQPHAADDPARARPRPPRLPRVSRRAGTSSRTATAARCSSTTRRSASASSRTVTSRPITRWEAWLAGLADVLGPLLTTIPPALGSRRPARPARPVAARVEAAQARRARRRDHDEAVHVEHRRPPRRLVRVTADARRAVGERRHRHLGRAAFGRYRVRDGPSQDRRRRRRRDGPLGLPARRHGRRDARAARRGRVVRRDGAHRRERRAHRCAETAARAASCSTRAKNCAPTSSSPRRTRRSRSSTRSTTPSSPTTSSPRSRSGSRAAAR